MKQFNELGLSAPVVEVIRTIGFQEPTAIQSMAIPNLLKSDTDLIALAQTGTGKTAAFGLPIIELTDEAANVPQALVLAPTRELALQISGELIRFAAGKSALKIATVYGGADIRKQIRELGQGVQIIVATPGRLKDLMTRNKVDLNNIRYVVLDEADEMLNMGFQPDIDHILEKVPDNRNTWLFSATMSREVQNLAGRYLQDPLELTAGERNTGNEAIDHQYLIVKRNEKYPALRCLLDFHEDFYGLLFCRTRRETQKMAEQLTLDGYSADALHGDMNQSQRERVMNRFRNRHIRVLVATDVAARGIDVDDLTHVLHFNIPDDIAFYTHRSGRTGRAGKEGTSIALLTNADLSMMRQVERRNRIKFQRIQLPDTTDVLRRKLNRHFHSILATEVRQEVHPLLDELNRELAHLSKEDLLARIASQVLDKIPGSSNSYPAKKEQNERIPGKSSDAFSGTRLFINVGRIDGFDKGAFLKMICENTGISGDKVGRIDLRSTHAYFDVEKSVADMVMKQFRNAEMEGRALRVNPANDAKKDKDQKKEKKKKKKGAGKSKPFLAR